MPLLSEGAGKNRAMCAGTRREVAIALAALQGAVSGKEQARQRLAVSISYSIKLVRKMAASETREQRAQAQALAKSVIILQRGRSTETPMRTPWKTRGVKGAKISGSCSTETPARAP